MAPAPPRRLDRGDVGLAERGVLGEDDDLLAGGVADEGLGGRARPGSDCRPERKVYLLMPVTASVAAGPEMNSTLFCAASGPTCRATPETSEPAMIL